MCSGSAVGAETPTACSFDMYRNLTSAVDKGRIIPDQSRLRDRKGCHFGQGMIPPKAKDRMKVLPARFSERRRLEEEPRNGPTPPAVSRGT